MAGLQAGRKIFTINEDLVFLRPFQELKCYQTRSEAALAGLQPGQCILKVNGNNMNHSDYKEVLEHFTSSHRDQQEQDDMVRHSVRAEPWSSAENGSDIEEENGRNGTDYRGGLSRLSLSDDTVPLVSMTVDNVHLEHGVVYEYVSTAGIKSHVLEKMVEPKGCFSLTAKILEAFASDDSHFVRNCSQLISQSERVFAQELRNKACPTFKQAGVLPHPLGCMDFVPTNCHVNLMQVSYPKTTTVSGRAFSIRFGRKNSFFGLDPDQANLNPMSHTQHCVTSMGAPSYSCSDLGEEGDGEEDIEGSGEGIPDRIQQAHRGNGLSFLLKQEDMETQDAYIRLYSRLNIAVREMRQYVTQIDVLLSSITEPTQPQGSESPAYEAIQPPSVTPEEGDQEKVEHGGIKRVCFMGFRLVVHKCT
ncbi:unnamed protein product [Coregonus sp. 'balchen']|nr:unnamed protein product [Coregonus sp. 'balchen']